MIDSNVNTRHKTYLLHNKHHLPIHRHIRNKQIKQQKIEQDNKCNCILSSLFLCFSLTLFSTFVVIQNSNSTKQL